MGKLRNAMGKLSLMDLRETKNTKPLKEVTPIYVHLDHPKRHVMIRTELVEELRDTLVEF